MDLFLWFLIIFFAYKILNLIMLAVFCRLMRKHDRGKINIQDNKYVDENPNKSEEKSSNSGLLKRIARSLVMNYGYGWMRYNVIKLGRFPSNRIRNLLYRWVYCAHITKQTIIAGGCEIRSPWNLYAGNCVIMNNCVLDARCGLVIKDNVVFGTGVHIWTMQHSIDSPTFETTAENMGAVIINERAWICSDTIILPRVTIGEGAVLASGSYANRDLEPFGVYGGMPAHKIKTRNKDLIYELEGKSLWHFY